MTGSGRENSPIYHVLERPEICEACLKESERRSSEISISRLSLPVPPRTSPPLPPLPALPASFLMSCSGDATYETVEPTRPEEINEQGEGWLVVLFS